MVDRSILMLPPDEGSGAPVEIHSAPQLDCERRGFKPDY
jgi:hypothetical protein